MQRRGTISITPAGSVMNACRLRKHHRSFLKPVCVPVPSMRGFPPLALALVVFGAASQAAESPASLEAAGDKAWRRAKPAFAEAYRAWESLAPRANAFKDTAAVERSKEARRDLAFLLRSPTRFQKAGTEPTKAARPPSTWLAEPSTPALGALEKLAKFFAAADKNFSNARDAEPRDALLVKEGVAFSQRLLGEFFQRQADQAYQSALALLTKDANEPVAIAARVRLNYKLRRYDEARDLLAASSSVDFSQLAADVRVQFLKTRWGLARFAGDATTATALANDLRKLGSVAEESSRPGASFGSFLSGRATDLAATVQTLHQVIEHPLPERDKALAAHLAGVAATELGDYALAEEFFRRHLPDASRGAWLAISSRARLGRIAGHLGDYEASLYALAAADAQAAKLEGTETLRARIAINAARSHLGLGQHARAREEAQRALATYGLPPALRVRARVLLGSVLYERARENPALLPDARAAFRAASRELDRVVKEKPELPDRDRLRASLDIDLANVLRLEAQETESPSGKLTDESRELRQEARRLQDAALRVADGAKLHAVASVAAANLGELFLEEGDLKAAEEFVAWASRWAEELGLFETRWRCHWYRGRIADARDDPERGDAEFAKALAIVESYRARVISLESKSGFLTDKISLYQAMVRRQLARNDADSALTAAERAKARTFVESLGWRYLPFSDVDFAAEYRHYVELLARNDAARRRPDRKYFGARVSGPSYGDLRARLKSLQEKLASRGESVRSLIDGAPIDAAEVRQLVPRGTTLLEYFSLGDRFVAFVVQDDTCTAVPLATSPDEIRKGVTEYVQGRLDDDKLCRQLYTQLVEPVAERLAHERLLIVPYGALHGLPFEALRDSGGKYVIERWAVSYLPSAGALRFFRRRDRPVDEALGLLAVVDPDTDYDRDGKADLPKLPGARQEVEGFAPMFRERQVLTGAEALEKACVSRSVGPDVVHYACHGEFYPARPWDSCLFLASGVATGPQADGRLRASEVLGLNLRGSHLVALSGCETAKVDVLPGDDTVSIGAAFLHAGAGALLASLWKVEDQATAALMRAFYERWVGEKNDKVHSLRQAKLALLRGEFRHPRQWSSFVLIGEP